VVEFWQFKKKSGISINFGPEFRHLVTAQRIDHKIKFMVWSRSRFKIYRIPIVIIYFKLIKLKLIQQVPAKATWK
jgi:hypothetical protein